MNLTALIRKGHLLPITTPDRHGIPMLTGWKRKPSSRKKGEWTLKKPTVWIDRLAIMQGKAMLPGAKIVRDERERQVSRLGWTAEHDDAHTDGELLAAANCYVKAPTIEAGKIPADWPWDAEWWKPSKDRIRDLAKAGALYLAEADRLKRTGKSDEAAEVEKLALGCAGMIDGIYGV